MVHRLLANAFLGCPEHVDHINDDPTDNRIENLRSYSRDEFKARSDRVEALEGAV
ncbi:MAG: HNH endonuclease [Fermentimonas sp.]|nr:HNH endonuclease [Fermentimonas sp.]